jgi:hypothetical protein
MSKIEYEESYSNVFDDLGLESANELSAHSQIGIHMFEILFLRS